MSTGPTAIELTRTGERTVELALEPRLFSGALAGLFRAPEPPFTPGWQRRLEGMTAEVLAVDDDGMPVRVEYRFDRELEDEELLWLEWTDEGWAPFQPPGVGRGVRLEPRCGPLDLLRPGC